jgi:hypothetical protein
MLGYAILSKCELIDSQLSIRPFRPFITVFTKFFYFAIALFTTFVMQHFLLSFTNRTVFLISIPHDFIVNTIKLIGQN